jgi:hypothetical protein
MPPVEDRDEIKKYVRWLFRIDSVAFLVLGIGVLILAIALTAVTKTLSLIFIGAGIGGIIAIITAFLGFIGSAYGNEGKNTRLKYLIANFTVVLIASLIAAVFAGFCFFFTDLGKTIIILLWEYYQNTFDTFNSAAEMDAEMAEHFKNYYIVGGVCIALFVALAIALISGGYLIGIANMIRVWRSIKYYYLFPSQFFS